SYLVYPKRGDVLSSWTSVRSFRTWAWKIGSSLQSVRLNIRNLRVRVSGWRGRLGAFRLASPGPTLPVGVPWGSTRSPEPDRAPLMVWAMNDSFWNRRL